MTVRASVYWLCDESLAPTYIGLTRSLSARLSGRTAPYIGIKYYQSRGEAELVECSDILLLKPIKNGTDYLICETFNKVVSGLRPYNSRLMTQREMRPPWYYAKHDCSLWFDALFEYDADCHASGFNASLRRPVRPPAASKDLAIKYTGSAERAPPDGWDGIMHDADCKNVKYWEDAK